MFTANAWVSEMLVPAAEAHGCGFGKGVNRRIAPFLGEWMQQIRLECQPLLFGSWVGWISSSGYHPSLFRHPRRGGRNRGFQKSPKLFIQKPLSRGLELCWLKLMLLGVLNNLHTDQLHFQLSCAGLVSLLMLQAGTLRRAACVLGVASRCGVESGWKINAGRWGVQRGW